MRKCADHIKGFVFGFALALGRSKQGAWAALKWLITKSPSNLHTWYNLPPLTQQQCT
jgi:hypothetical protein